ncbi:MAG TPA: carboxypeptidase regulatory-like domain-containing protein [Gemmatimonadaceae bacterium]|nr:carboxypeptidase regulatory-like domain-containing protein [Gemmatimonadaceae bacterium]
MPPAPYQVIAVENGGGVTGTVTVHSGVLRDTVVQVIGDRDVCGARRSVPLVDEHGGRVGHVVVWLTDARRGKALSRARRFDLSTEQCALDPRIQAVTVNGTLDLFNADPAIHRTRFVRAHTGATIALVTETDAGQVVPVRSVLDQPGLVEVRCDMHPHTRGWIRVFDQPYFDVTDSHGRFALSDVPPGTYHLAAWQPRLGMRTQTVTVRAGEATQVTIAF